MDYEKRIKRQINPKHTANIFSTITFWYTRELFKKGSKQELEERDLYEVLPEYDSCVLGDRMEREWDQQKHHKRFSMYLVFWNMFGKFYLLLGLTKILQIIISVLRPIVIGKVVSYFIPGQTKLTKADAYLYSFLLVLLHLTDDIYKQNYYFMAECLTIKIRTAICSLIYRKMLKLPASHLRRISFGKITNLITRDINVFDMFFLSFNEAWTGLITTVIICYQMFQKIGLPTVVVIAALAVFMPFQILMGMWIGSLKTKTSIKTDKRVSVMQEVLSNIRSVKMYVWEKHLKPKISTAREEEMNILLKMISVFFFSLVAAIIIYNATFYLVLMTCIWLGHSLTAETMYYITGCFLSMSFNLVVTIPWAMLYGSQVLVSIKRMQALTQKLEVTIEEEEEINTLERIQPQILLRNVTVQAASKVLLKNVTIKIDAGLTLVNGSACSGKTAFLMTLLKEFEVTKRSLLIEGRISYASQEPWLFPSTIKQNIIFGSKYDEKRYQDVITACALQYDFDLMENGDSTVVADRGINLSKGQKTRISLARTVYKESDIYLLDECLSSLDSVVARFIFNKCILQFLHKKIVILVTHDANLVPYATNVLTIVDGDVKFSKNELPQAVQDCAGETMFKHTILKKEQFETENDVDSNSKLFHTQNTEVKVYGEHKKSGPVSSQIYKTYINLGGGRFFLFVILCFFFIAQLSLSYKDKLISDWANLEEQISQSNASTNSSQYEILTKRRNMILYKYTAAIFGISLTTLIRAYALFRFSKNASISLHKKMLNSVLNAALVFFDRTFIGNIINRFSKDLITVDENVSFNLFHLTAIVFETAGSLFLMSFVTPKLLVPTVLLLVSFVYLKQVYLKIGRPLKRLDASTKSPVVGYLNTTMEGLPSIKAFRAQHILKTEFERRQDLYTSASYSHLCCMKAFIFCAESLTSVLLAIVILHFVIFDKDVSPGYVGLAITQAFVMGSSFYFGIYKWADLEIQMTSVERVCEYTNIEQERKTGLVVQNWPKSGEIKYENVYLFANETKTCLLKNISFFIEAKEKIGIVGRTGAGKSSIVSALFRLYESKGKITIDGIDVKTLSLDFLRSYISVIPQDPVLFNGTLRDNIDPGKVHNDEEIWNAIKAVKLNHFVSTLDVNIENLELTSGQKQLLCLIRVLIKKNKILVLDEMIENLDPETESLIYDVIDAHFASYTVIKIAHKLGFVMKCDKIMVMDNGEIIEYDTPEVLLHNRNSIFYKMAQKSGLNSEMPML